MHQSPALRVLSRTPSWVIGLVSGLVYSAAAVTAVGIVRPKYFHVDDALNAELPTSAGLFRVLSSGALPILNPWAMSGGNHLINLARAPFHPVTLLATGAWGVTGANGVALFTVFLDLVTIFTGVFLLARAGFGLGRKWSLIAAFLVATQPLLIGVFVTSWWVISLGIGAYAWAAGALLWAARDPRPGRLLLLGVTTFGVFAAGWPHSWLAFAGTCVLVAIYAVVASNRRGVQRLVTPALLAAAVGLGTALSVPTMSEYLAASRAGLLHRDSGLNNVGNFLNPSLSQIFGFANPSAGDFFNNFAGYTWIPIPIGFVSLLFWVAIFFSKHTSAVWRSDRLLQLIVANAAAFYLCSQLPSQLGPTRWGFRYLPYATLFMAIGCVYYLAKTQRVWSRGRFTAAAALVAISAMTGAWKVPDPAVYWYSLVTPSIFAVGTIAILYAYSRPRWRPRLELGLVGLSALVVVLQIPAYGGFFTNADTIPSGEAGAKVRAAASGGFLFDGISGWRLNQWAPGFGSGRYEIYDVDLVNSYDSVGHAAFMDFLPQVSSHNFQKPAALITLGQAAPAPFQDRCMFDVMRVIAVFTDTDSKVGQHAVLTRCGFTLQSSRGHTALFVHPRPASDPDSTVSVATSGTSISADHLVNAQVERVEVNNTTSADGRVAFARIWWPGYHATINGRPVATESLNGLFVTVVVPPGTSGTLELSYWPSTWGWALPISGAGALGLLVLCGVLAWRDRRLADPSRDQPSATQDVG